MQGLLYIIPWMAAVPLYLTGGVVVTAALRDDLGFWKAAAVAVAVSAFTKALAVYALHQSLGVVRTRGFVMRAPWCFAAADILPCGDIVAPQTWMKQAKIRKDFELRSIRMRAMEMILFRGWLDRAKVRAASCCPSARVKHEAFDPHPLTPPPRSCTSWLQAPTG